MFSFKITHQSKFGRTGIIKTDHGIIKTPAFVPVGTQGSIKSLTPEELKEIGVQIFFVNTYHMMVRSTVKVIEKFQGLHRFINWSHSLITDSGGFQVFSLGRGGLVKIDQEGVSFRSHWDGKLHRLTPAKSIQLQHLLKADIMIAFDDCPPYPVAYKEAEKSLERTHHWAVLSLETHQKNRRKNKSGVLYGSIQGSVYQDLRIKSAKFISALPFDGYAIGGVAVGESKKEMNDVLHWVVPHLPFNKPRHLLGVGEIDDIFNLVKAGIDTFDCVMPTRLARMGQILVKNEKRWRLDIFKSKFARQKNPLEKDCRCYTCQNFSRAYLHHLFKTRELLAYRLATIHNLYFIETLMKKIRQGLKNNQLSKVEKEYQPSLN